MQIQAPTEATPEQASSEAQDVSGDVSEEAVGDVSSHETSGKARRFLMIAAKTLDRGWRGTWSLTYLFRFDLADVLSLECS